MILQTNESYHDNLSDTSHATRNMNVVLRPFERIYGYIGKATSEGMKLMMLVLLDIR